MGILAETKIRRKLQQDPNNTKWTRNENTFGQKILRAQGWQPGQYLGVQDSNHAELHTAASASYIRVSMKDDMKGLGFDRAAKEDEISGLDAFTDLLSRLNGKSSEAVAEEQRARLVVKTHRFVEQRYGAMRFVRGGLLVGDELKADDNEPKATPKVKEPVDDETKKAKGDKATSKKRKGAMDETEEDESSSSAEPEAKNKKRKTTEESKSSRKRSAAGSRDDTPSTEAEAKAKRKEKRSKKDKPVKDASGDEIEAPTVRPRVSAGEADEPEPSKSKKSKEERKEEKRLKKLRKAEKKEAKEAKRRKKAEAKTYKSTSPDDTSAEEVMTTTTTTTAEATPAGSGTSTPRGNPHFVRSRFLKAKREAMLDSNAINKIFMVKA